MVFYSNPFTNFCYSGWVGLWPAQQLQLARRATARWHQDHHCHQHFWRRLAERYLKLHWNKVPPNTYKISVSSEGLPGLEGAEEYTWTEPRPNSMEATRILGQGRIIPSTLSILHPKYLFSNHFFCFCFLRLSSIFWWKFSMIKPHILVWIYYILIVITVVLLYIS